MSQENTFSNPPIKPDGKEVIELKPLTLTKAEGWFKLNDSYIVLKFAKNFVKNRIKIVVIKNNAVVASYEADGSPNCWNTQIIVDGADICSEIAKLIDNYQDLVEQYELVEKAKAAQMLDHVPSLPKDWEALVYSLTKYVLNSRIVKAFYTYQGAREVVLGVYCYESGYYKECEDTLKHEIAKLVSTSSLLDMRLAPTLAGVVVKNIEMRTLEQYAPAKHCLLFKNKVFCWGKFLESGDIESALIEPSPELVVTHKIPWEVKPEILRTVREGLLKYVPPKGQDDLIELFKALAPKSFKAFIDWVKKPGEEERAAYSRVVLLLEIIGYTLYPHAYPFHKAVLLVGEGANGKSTYLRLIETILSKQNVASVSLDEFDPKINRFATADLYGKLANLSSEPAKGVIDPTRFKMATGEDLMPFEWKHRDRIRDYNYAKMIFSANELPQISDDTYATWRRWIVLEFPNRFKPDPEFFDKTFTSEEVEVIILLALHAFRLVLERKGFTEAGVQDVREEWLSRSNPVYRVVKRMLDDGVIELDPQGLVIKSDLYQLYKKYIEIMNNEGFEISTLEQKDFTRHLTRYFPIKATDRRVMGRVRHVYVGVKIKDYDKALQLVGELETPEATLDAI
ncbi:MAG: phage/plasmid primase, P4 family [Thermosphaera sp.]